MVDLQRLREVPGVKGTVRVSLGGELQDHSIDGSPDIVADLTTRLSATARRVAAVMGYEDFVHALLSYRDGGNPLLIIPQESSFIGLLLDVPQTLVGISDTSQTFYSRELIAASHILTRIRGLMESE
jgi:predicted regulator of Ras-like GTPase activity (Roadblock/LC7/MglB family)